MNKSIFFYPNGATAVTDEKGEQVPRLQTPWIKLFVEFLESRGEDPTSFEINLPDGKKARSFRTPAGYGLEIEE